MIEVPKCEKLRPQGQFFQSCTKKILSGTDRPKHSLDPIDYKLIDKNSFILLTKTERDRNAAGEKFLITMRGAPRILPSNQITQPRDFQNNLKFKYSTKSDSALLESPDKIQFFSRN